MKKKPAYAENIIVCVKLNEIYKWYVTVKNIWFLDLRKLISAYIENGYFINDPEDFSERFDIDIVDSNNAKIFLDKIKDYEVSCNELKKMILNKQDACIIDMVPSLFVNFDKKELISYYPELASFEKYVPDKWSGKYGKFYLEIPTKNKYWIVNGINLLNKEEYSG